MKNNGGKISKIQKREKLKQIISNKKKLNKTMTDNNHYIIKNNSKNMNKNKKINNIIYNEDDSYNNFSKFKKQNHSIDYRKIYSKDFNNNINSTLNKSKFTHYINIKNDLNNSMRGFDISNYKSNKNYDLFLSTKFNNIKGNISSYSLNEKKIYGKGTKLDISKSEIQYPLNYSKNNIRNKYELNNNSNSSTENNNSYNKEINLRISSKFGNKNIKEKIKKYDIASPSSNLFNKKLRQSAKNINDKNRRKNNEIYSPDIINKENNREMKYFKSSIFSKKDNNESINTHNSSYNFYQKDDFKRRKKNEIHFNLSLNNTINNFGFNNEFNEYEAKNTFSNKINRNNEIPDICFEKNIVNNNYNNEDMIIRSPEFNKLNHNNRIQNDVNININDFLLYQNEILEEFCGCLEEYMFINVKNNFNLFIKKLREYSKQKYFNFLLLKCLQKKSIKRKFYEKRDSSYDYLNEKENTPYNPPTTNNNINIYKKHAYYMNRGANEGNVRKTFDNTAIEQTEVEKLSAIRKNTLHRKSQKKCFLKNLDSFYKSNNYHTNIEINNNDRPINQEKYDTNLYIPKKYKHINNSIANTNFRKYISYNYNKKKPYYPNMNISKEESKILDNNINNEFKDEFIKSKIERSINIKDKKRKNHNISCDIKHNINYYFENDVMDKTDINLRTSDKNEKLVINKKITENEIKPIYNKKKIIISQPKSKIFKSKQIQSNNKNKAMIFNDKIMKEEQKFNINKKIKDKNNSEHYRIMTLSSNVSDNSYDMEMNQIAKDESNERFLENHKLSSTKKVQKKDIIENKERKNIENIKEEKINNANIDELNSNNNIEVECINVVNDDNGKIYDKNNNHNNSYINMSNGKNSKNEEFNDNECYIKKEIIVKDVSTKDKRVNVFIKYIEDNSFNGRKPILNKATKKYLLNIFQTDTLFYPALNPSLVEQKNLFYKSNKLYKNMNDKNHQIKMNKILSSIIEEEERSKAGYSINNSVLSDEERLKNENYSYFFIQSLKYFINFLQSIFNYKKKSLYFSFFKNLQKIQNDFFIKGLIEQKKNQNQSQTMKIIKEVIDDKDNYKNNENDIENMNMDFNYIKEKNINKNPKNTIRDNDNKINNNHHSLFSKEKLYNNNKKNINLSMDNFYMDKINKNNNNFDKDILNKLGNNSKNIEIKNENMKNGNGNIIKNIEDNNVTFDYEKNVTLSDAFRKFTDVIQDFRVGLMKYSMKKK